MCTKIYKTPLQAHTSPEQMHSISICLSYSRALYERFNTQNSHLTVIKVSKCVSEVQSVLKVPTSQHSTIGNDTHVSIHFCFYLLLVYGITEFTEQNSNWYTKSLEKSTDCLCRSQSHAPWLTVSASSDSPSAVTPIPHHQRRRSSLG